MADQAIGIFTELNTGEGAAKMEHADGRRVTRAAPLKAGEVATLYLTGLGETMSMPMHIYFDETEGRILSYESAIGAAGLYRMTVQTPDSLRRRYPIVRVQSPSSASNQVSAGGPSLLDITPGSAAGGTDLWVKVRGLNLPPGAALQIGSEIVPAMPVKDEATETVTATIPGRLLRDGTVPITVVDPSAPDEAPSNRVWLTITR